jgi:hypothetical protein
MKLFSKQNQVLALFSLVFFCAAATAKAGLDSYEIYLNEKLILKQYVNEPLKLASLQLSQANINDRIVINYSQCNMPDKIGRGRSISVKDANGKTVKVWKFANASGKKVGMVIPVKELLALNNLVSGKDLAFYYAADGLTQGQMLAHFQLANKPVSYKKPLLNNNDASALLFPSISVFRL